MKLNPEKLEKLINKTPLNYSSNGIPDVYIAAVECVMGEMNLEPGCEMSHWPDGRVFLNTYTWRNGKKLIPLLMEEFEAGRVTEAVVAAHNHHTGAGWFQPLFNGTMCFINHGHGNNKGVCFVYFGPNRSEFTSVFSQFGNVVEKVNRRNLQVC
jgi:hypothetical protein